MSKVAKQFRSRVLCEAHGIAPHNGPNYVIFNNSLEAGLVGQVERLLRVPVKDDEGNVIMDEFTGMPKLKMPPKPLKYVWNDHLYYEKAVANHVGKHLAWNEEEFVASRRCGKIRARYLLAHKEYLKRGFKASDGDPQCMVKAEKMKLKKFMTPRIIQYCNPVFNLLLGKYVSSAEKKIYEAIDLVWDPTGRLKTIMKGYNSEEVATLIRMAWLEVDSGKRDFHLINQGDDNIIIIRVKGNGGVEETVALVVDAERFDQHVHYDTLMFEHHLYKRIYKNAPKWQRAELAMLLRHQSKYNMKSWFKSEKDGRTYRVDIPNVKGRRRSGDMNTSLGNNYLATALLHGFLKDYKVTNLSDLKEGLSKYSLDHGFTIKFEGYATCIEEIEFCQSHPVNSGHYRRDTRFNDGAEIERWIMVRNLDAIVKDTAFICEKQNVPERMSQIGIAGKMMYADIPIMGALYHRLSNGATVRPYTWQENAWQSQGLAWQSGLAVDGMNIVTQASDDITEIGRTSYEKAFGVTPMEQILAADDILATVESSKPFSSQPWYAPWYSMRDDRTRIAPSIRN